jgi:hypothetical protein
MRQREAITWAGVTILFAALTAVMLWPIVRSIGTHSAQHQDVFFNMWRLRWFAHALSTSPRHLFDANIFYPERDTLAYSDAMIVEGLVAAPFSKLNPVLVHNVMLLLPIVASAMAIFALCRYLTGSRGAGLVAATAFAFAPFRFEHIMHLELQWTIWMPLAFLALHRLLDGGRWRDGLAFGACLALQMLSCIYYGIFLATLAGAAVVLLFLSDRRVGWRRALPPLAAGLAIAAAASAVYALPYQRAHSVVGDRPVEQVYEYSAQPSNYLVVPEGNWLYGNPGRPGRGERRLFPGALVVLLAVAGLSLRRLSPRQIVYLLLLAVAFDMSLGFSGVSYPLMLHLAGPFRALRALARLGIFVVMFLAVLAAYGYSFVVASWRPALRAGVCAALVAGMIGEYATRVQVAEFPTAPAPVFRVLAHLRPGVVLVLPVPRQDRLPGEDAEYDYLSTFFWFPIVNGYSGNYPPSYLMRLDRLFDITSDRAVRQIDHDGVRYAIVRTFFYQPPQLDAVKATLAKAGMVELGSFDDGTAPALLFTTR